MNPWLKILLEIGPLAVFFAVFQGFKDSPVTIGETTYEPIVVATALFIPAILAALFVSRWLTREWPKMAVATAIIVVLFGGLTIWLNDDLFIKMKPTILNFLFGVALAVGLFQGRSYLKYLMGEAMPLDDEGWMAFTWRWMWFFFFMGALNEVVWRVWDTEAWVNYKTFLSPLLTFGFMASQFPLLKRHMRDDG